ncbi:insulinase family protein [Candidatus Pacearchaeota archaeon]|nr:insulinase family protein [Candidatus Pacearchaeota archaeon]
MKPKFYRKVLKNGMTIIFEKRENPVVSVAFAVRYGGINEASHEKGISHFIEHLLYKGTPIRNSRQIAEEIERKGGLLNGFTDETVTAYWCKIPSRHLDIALDVLGDMVKNPLFDEEELEKEKKVIFEEIKMGKDNPSNHSFKEIQRLLYKEPLGSPLIGTEKTLKSLTRKKILERFQGVYGPNNMILCVVGDADFKDIVDFAEKNFSGKKEIAFKHKIVKRNGSKIEKRKGIDQANLILAYHFPTSDKKISHAANVLNVLMAGGMSSRLFHEIREKRNLAYAIKGESVILRNFSYGLVYAGTKKENVQLIKKIILDEFRKVSKELDEKELNQVKEQMIGNYQISMEDSQNQMVNLLMHEIDRNAEDAYEFEKNIRNVKLRDVKNLAKIKKYSFFALVPK